MVTSCLSAAALSFLPGHLRATADGESLAIDEVNRRTPAHDEPAEVATSHP
jgi:hypothetical protein